MLSSTALQGRGGGSPFPLGLEESRRSAGEALLDGDMEKDTTLSWVSCQTSKVLKCSGSIFCDFKEYKLPFMDESRFEVDPASRL